MKFEIEFRYLVSGPNETVTFTSETMQAEAANHGQLIKEYQHCFLACMVTAVHCLDPIPEDLTRQAVLLFADRWAVAIFNGGDWPEWVAS